MTALSRLLPTIELHGIHEICATYDEAIAEYRENAARRAREDWLMQDYNLIVKRINLIRAKQRYAIEERLCPITLAERLRLETEALELNREELRKLRSEA